MKIKTLVLIVVLAAIAGSIYYLGSTSVPITAPSSNGASADLPLPKETAQPSSTPSKSSSRAVERIAQKARGFERGKELVSPDGFINTEKISIGDLVGKKVVLVDFWTYSCINCIRTLPYLNAWYEKYKNLGLEIIGVHSPEFEFEKKYENVAAAVKKFGIKYPVVLDNEHATWSAYGNLYWPREYLIDIDGFIVHDKIGEGDYEGTEAQIQKALAERMAILGQKKEISAGTTHPSGTYDLGPGGPGSPEAYFGAARNQYLGNGAPGTVGTQKLSEPANLEANTLYLSGEWNFADEYAANKSSGAKIIFRYKAKDVYFVAGASAPLKIKVLKDGKPLGADKGGDVVIENGESVVTVQAERLYKLIHGADWNEHTIEIIIESPGLNAFTFTFG